MKLHYWIWVTAALVANAADARQNPWNQSFDTRADMLVSTLGAGAGLAFDVSPSLALRVERHWLTFSFDTGVNALNYAIDMDWTSTPIIASWYPGREDFRIDGGVVVTDNRLSLAVSGAAIYTINGNPYDAAVTGDITSKVRFETPAWYVGVGWDKLFKKYPKLGLSLNTGVLFQGQPQVELELSQGTAGNADLARDVAIEERALMKKLELLRYYPVIGLSLTYRFAFP